LNTPSPSKWHAVARARDVSSRPLRIVLDGQPLVIFRSAGTLRCLADRCPHRFAPLSEGRLVGDAIECPYHGWRFEGTGRCTAIPGLTGPVPALAIPSFAICQEADLVFVSRESEPGVPYAGVLQGPGVIRTMSTARVRSRLIDVAENILDATHTHFTHKAILRGLSSRRYRVKVTITGGDGWTEARYEGEPRQEGLISRLLEGERSISIGRFVAPGIAELEFWGRDRINLATTFFLRQEDEQTVSGFGVLAGPKQGGLGYLKTVPFKLLFGIALRQDQRILEAAAANRPPAGSARGMLTQIDVLRPHIEAILQGKRPSVADNPQEVVMEL